MQDGRGHDQLDEREATGLPRATIFLEWSNCILSCDEVLVRRDL